MKKFLAWALSLCMMVAMLPAIPAQTASAAETLTYSFNANDYLASGYVAGTDSSSGVADTQYAYIAALPGTAGAYSVTNLSDFAKTLTYEKTKTKGAPWKLSSTFVTQMKYDASKADAFSTSPTWTRFYKGSRGLTLYVYGNANRKVQIGITLKVEEGNEGWYEVVPSYLFNARATTDAGLTFTLYNGASDTSSIKLSSEKMTTKSSQWQGPSLGKAYFEAGEYLLTMQLDTLDSTSTASGANTASVRNVKLIPVVVENSDIFGNCGAYIHKTDSDTYSATFLSGINGLDYKEVGFIVTVPGVGEFTLPTTNAYTSIAVENNSGTKTVNTASFGMGDDAFVFMATKDGIPTSITSATFQPYAIPADGSATIYGKAFTATYVAQ